MSQAPRVAIRADGNTALGIGHLRRCLILARMLKSAGYTVTFVRSDRSAGTLIELAPEFRTSWLDDAAPIADGIGEAADELKDADVPGLGGRCRPGRLVVVVDHYSRLARKPVVRGRSSHPGNRRLSRSASPR